MIVDRTIHIAHVGAFGVNHSPWVHMNLLDISPPGHDILAVLHDPNGRNARIAAWADALSKYDKGLLYVKGLRKGVPLSGVSIEGEQIVPVPHDMSMMHPKDTLRGLAIAIEKVLRAIAAVMGVDRVIPYGSAQVLEKHLDPTQEVHYVQAGRWYAWHHRDAGPLRGVPPCQSMYATDDELPSKNIVSHAIDRHAASGRISESRPLAVFIAPTDVFSKNVVEVVRDHPVPCRLVSWHKSDTDKAAGDGALAVAGVARACSLRLGC